MYDEKYTIYANEIQLRERENSAYIQIYENILEEANIEQGKRVMNDVRSPSKYEMPVHTHNHISAYICIYIETHNSVGHSHSVQTSQRHR